MARSRWIYYALAALVTFIFWWSGIAKLFGFSAATAEMAQFGLEPAAFFAALTILVQLLGSALVIAGGRWVWLGAGMLIVMTLGTIPVAHRFWEMSGVIRMLELALVQEHFSVVGGLLLAVVAAEYRNRQS